MGFIGEEKRTQERIDVANMTGPKEGLWFAGHSKRMLIAKQQTWAQNGFLAVVRNCGKLNNGSPNTPMSTPTVLPCIAKGTLQI